MNDPEWSPRAAYHLGELLWAAGDADRALGHRHDIVEDARDLSVGWGRGIQKWRRWVRRDDS